MEEDFKKVNLIELLRTFKKEGLDNFVVIRKENFKKFIPISVIQNKKSELEEERSNKLTKNDGWDEYREYAIEVLEDILEKGR